MDNFAAAESPRASLTLEQGGDRWWIGGETYPHRQTLKTLGCRWSKRRQQWYYVGVQLPRAIRVLVDATQAAAQPALQDEPAEMDLPGDKTLRAHRVTTTGREFVGSKDYVWIVEGTPTTSGEQLILAQH